MKTLLDGNFEDIEKKITPRAFQNCKSNSLLIGMKVRTSEPASMRKSYKERFVSQWPFSQFSDLRYNVFERGSEALFRAKSVPVSGCPKLPHIHVQIHSYCSAKGLYCAAYYNVVFDLQPFKSRINIQ